MHWTKWYKRWPDRWDRCMKSQTGTFQVDNTDRKLPAIVQKLIQSGNCLTYSVISLLLKPHDVSEAVSPFVIRQNTSTMKYTELGPFNGARQHSRALKRGIFFQKSDDGQNK